MLNEAGEYPIYITAPAGSYICATHEDGRTFEDYTDSSGSVIIWVDQTGEYTITGSTNGTGLTSVTVTIFDESFYFPGPNPIESNVRFSASFSYPATAKVSTYGLVSGGGYNYTYVDAFNTNLVRTSPPSLSGGGGWSGGTQNNNYALFAGGTNKNDTYSSANDIVNAYNSSLTRSLPTVLSAPRYYSYGTDVGSYGIFASGLGKTASGGLGYLNIADAYNLSLTHSNPTSVSNAVQMILTASTSSHALFAGGAGTSYVSTVNAYNTSCTKSTATSLSTAKIRGAGCSSSNYAVFAGGTSSEMKMANVEAYNTSLTKKIVTSLSLARMDVGAAYNKGFYLFGGGNSGPATDIVDVYNSSLTKVSDSTLSTNIVECTALDVGDYILMFGSRTNLDVFKMVST